MLRLRFYSLMAILFNFSLSIAQAEQFNDDEQLSQDFIEFLLEMEQTTTHEDGQQVLEHILFEEMTFPSDQEPSSRLSGALVDE